MHTAKNAALVAIMQVCVLTAGVLVSGLWNQILGHDGAAHPPAARYLTDYGLLGLGVPLVWVFVFLYINMQRGAPELLKQGLFWLGFALLIGCIVLVLSASLIPFVNLDWGLVGNEEE